MHHDILRILSHNDLLNNLTFIGGTCLRSCYGGIRLSEDLDFTGGKSFTRQSLSAMSKMLIESLTSKYGLLVRVTEPMKDKGNVDTWKIKVETRPGQKDLPAQSINIDICSVPSYEKRPMLLLNPYGVDMGTSGLIIQAQSREEIYTDKLVAFAFRPNRIKYRDLWDMVWLHQQGLKPSFTLIPNKLQDRHLTLEDFFNQFEKRKEILKESNENVSEFQKEMQRFLPPEQTNQIMKQDNLWDFIIYLIEDLEKHLHKIL